MNPKAFKRFVFPAILSIFFLLPILAHAEPGAQSGDSVTLEYTGTLGDGTVFDSSKGKSPLTFKLGEGRVIPGFEKAVMGMKKGEEKKFTLQPAEAYGDANPELVHQFPRSEFPQGQEPKVGMMMMLGGPNGQQARATITEVTHESVTLDMNHPLAGKALTFQIQLTEITR
ncbi:MAG: peptidylprolyl isomerase [Nitrospinaceae bacterium]|nr:MAG: peptidylprolyl isomerase [Nitrospinaceae bacterium]